MRSEVDRLSRPMVWLGFCCLIAAAAYLPILRNGFIADDYVILKRVEILKSQPLYLYGVPPENFRFVSYVIFGVLKAVAGYHAWPFYAFNIVLHLVNIVLLWRFLRDLLQDEIAAGLAALLFGVFQAPQEAVMWLAAMNETTLFFFTLLTLLFWMHHRYGLATIAYALALFSKESALVIPLLILLVDWYTGRKPVLGKYALLLLPSVGFLGIFAYTLSKNFMLTNRSYALSFHAGIVLFKSLHRLIWPWLYIIVGVVWLQVGKLPSLKRIVGYIGAIVVTMLPYMFIAYQSSLPSRQLYLASAVLMTLFATQLRLLNGAAIRRLVIGVFVLFNIGYLWWRKQPQFQERAAPTTQLIDSLKERRPQPTIISNFAYPFPEIATSAVLAVPGWESSLVMVEEGKAPCDCLRLEWDKSRGRYAISAGH
jgi:hypothetical protein